MQLGKFFFKKPKETQWELNFVSSAGSWGVSGLQNCEVLHIAVLSELSRAGAARSCHTRGDECCCLGISCVLHPTLCLSVLVVLSAFFFMFGKKPHFA